MKSVNSKDIVILALSAFLTALAVKLCFTEYVLTPGGITGLSIALSLMSGISVDIISLTISLPLLILATYILGKHFGIKTLYVTLMVPLFLRFIPLIHITDSILIASIVGGLLVGASISLALSSKCATGGTDVIALLIKKFVPKLELASILFVLDMIIVLLSMIISRTYITSMYSVVALLTIMMTIKLSKKVLSYE
jgi:uncharacterized membrane-anchored protein YitT (DUF2179 family)